jgi:hypothetical protein
MPGIPALWRQRKEAGRFEFPGQLQSETISQKKNKGWGCSSVVDRLPSMHKSNGKACPGFGTSMGEKKKKGVSRQSQSTD